MEPQDAHTHWDRRHAREHDLGTAMRKHGRNMDWLIAGVRAPTWGFGA